MDRAWGCMLATYRSYRPCWTELGAVCWQPTGLMRPVGPILGLHVGNLQLYVGNLQPVGPGLGLYVGNLGLIGPVGPSLGLYVGNLQVLCGLLDRAWGCMLATYRSYRPCWTELGAVCWQPRSYRPCWTELGAVCWQPTGLMRPVGPSLGLYVGNLQVLWGLLDRAWGCMWATGDSLFRGLCFCVGFTTSLKERIRRIPDILCGMLIMVYLFILLIHLFTYLLIYLFTDLFIYLFMCFGASKPETNIVRPHEPSHAVLLCLAR